WGQIRWRARIEKIELPGLPALDGLGGEEGGGTEEGAAPGASLLGSILGMGGGAGGAEDAAGAAGGGGVGEAVLSSQFELIKNVLEESIRKVPLEVSWAEDPKQAWPERDAEEGYVSSGTSATGFDV